MGIKILLVIIFIIPIMSFSALFCVFSSKLKSMEATKEALIPKEDTNLEFNTLSKWELNTIARGLLRKERKQRKRNR